MYTAAVHAGPGLTIPISRPSSTTAQRVFVSHGPSLNVCPVACEVLCCWHTNYTWCIKFFILARTNYFYSAQNLKTEKVKIDTPCDVASLLISSICLLVVCACVRPGACGWVSCLCVCVECQTHLIFSIRFFALQCIWLTTRKFPDSIQLDGFLFGLRLLLQRLFPWLLFRMQFHQCWLFDLPWYTGELLNSKHLAVESCS
jgi:hypothetical protein